MSLERSSELSRQQRVFVLLAQVCELDPAARERVLAECDDAEVVREVRRKLAAEPAVDGWLEMPPLEMPPLETPALEATTTLQIGDRVGPFEVRALLGEGGMGRVFRAVQRQPVQREVALKILRVGRLHREAAVRFEAERHAMGRLDHPHIGRILEAGTTDDELPYFAMELIDGPPITSYCDRHELSIEERLRLFLDVCRATHHAHLKLLLHRDLKPSNVLVAEVDGRAVPKIIDFGIAKGLNAPLVTAAEPTGDGFLGTLAYMSPEALETERTLDVRSDVFSLGILLYELLTGGLPWTVPDSDPFKLLKRRLERDADSPSTHVTELAGSERDRIARLRRLDSERLATRLRGDLDSLVMKAIEPEPERRYGSAAELADDIERHLADEPIRARPLTTTVLLRKLLRRHRGPALAAGLVLLALLVGAVGTVGGLLRAREAERQAVAAEQEAVDEARTAVQARDEADEVVDFLVRLFRASNAHRLETDQPPGEITALDLLARGAERIETELADQPVTRARLETTIGNIYRNLGDFERARALHRASVETLEALDAPPARQLASSYLQLVRLEMFLAENESATRHLEAALALLESLPGDTLNGDEAQVLRAEAFDSAGRLRQVAGDFEGAIDAQKRSIEAYSRLDDSYATGRASAHHNLGVTYITRRRPAEAEEQFRQAIAVIEPLVEDDHPRLAMHTLGLGAALASQDRLEEAVEIFERVERTIRRRLGAEHHERADVLHNLGKLHHDLEQLDRAEAYHREALAIREAALGPEHAKTAAGLYDLALTVAALGRDDEARQLQERSLAVRESIYGAEHLTITENLRHLAELARRRDDPERALELARRAEAIQTTQLEPGHPDLGHAAVDVGEALWLLGRRDEARQRFDEARAIFEVGGDAARDELAALNDRLTALGTSD